MVKKKVTDQNRADIVQTFLKRLRTITRNLSIKFSEKKIVTRRNI